jgi:Cu/Ag efflux pump CusA
METAFFGTRSRHTTRYNLFQPCAHHPSLPLTSTTVITTITSASLRNMQRTRNRLFSPLTSARTLSLTLLLSQTYFAITIVLFEAEFSAPPD